ncbi:class F sortase [Kitasatospora kifunensis]|uniref:Sortase (Surface protein transpeptidase) n=1 Tax=Kitasatospora kifunensis TaxID=58351 RepID=A0A7W7R9H5_KITKI|nr:class F sortase [Kitasatospora kifunensis]MBB4927922.1 sortase (surface protein transpeptidase) [Kitasatospora kifunensis]
MRQLPPTALRASVAALSAIALTSGVWLIHNGSRTTAPPRPSAAQAFASHPSSSKSPTPTPQSPPNGPPAASASASDEPELELEPEPQEIAPPAVPAPTRVKIPSLGVDAPLTGLSLQPDGVLEAPDPNDTKRAGWYKDGTRPGAVGTAVIAGHVDSMTGPAVFYKLGLLKKGSDIEVDQADGHTALFTVDAVETYPLNAFPDAQVYDAADRPELRLITCGGDFNKKEQKYLGNTVVYAHLINPT